MYMQDVQENGQYLAVDIYLARNMQDGYSYLIMSSGTDFCVYVYTSSVLRDITYSGY